MPASIREQIMVALEAELVAIAGVQSVARNRAEEFTADQLPALNLLDGDQAPVDRSTHGIDVYVTAPSVEGFVAAADSEAALTALNDLCARVQQRLGGLTSPPFSGLAVRVDEGALTVDPARDTQEEPQAGFRLELEVEYWTKPGDPYQAGP